MKNIILYFLISVLFIACINVSLQKRIQTKNKILNNKNTKQITYNKAFYKIYSIQSMAKSCKNIVNIYIEGDGLAWETKYKISSNPTPINPLALKLMLNDSSSCKIYLARPCQYVNDKNCKKEAWTNARFSENILTTYMNVLNEIKQAYSLKKFNLIGYSGGGAIATLLSTKRDDIDTLITVSGNLDTTFWTNKHNVSPLNKSLNPSNFIQKITVKQCHLIGKKDKNVGVDVFKSYYNRFENKSKISYKIYENFDHTCCWDEVWSKIKFH